MGMIEFSFLISVNFNCIQYSDATAIILDDA